MKGGFMRCGKSIAFEWMQNHKGMEKKKAIAACVKKTGCGRTTAYENYMRVNECSRGYDERWSNKNASTKTALKGIPLSGVNVSNTKPNDGLKSKIFSLRKGSGFPVSTLSEKWHVSEETIKKHAKKEDALKYVEVSPGEWVQCVINPQTEVREV
jgi:hypothetical protein